MNYRLDQLFKLQMGKTPARANLEYWNGTKKWVSISDLSGYDKYVADTKECISDLGISESGIKVVPKDTVIMSFKLSIGKTAITTEDVYTNEAIMAFIDKGVCEIDTDYLYYLFSGMDWYTGTNKAVLGLTLNKATLSKKEIDIPDLHTQNEVVKKLDSLSKLIQLQKQSMDKLDELVKSRFVEMFGDIKLNPYNWDIIPFSKLTDIITDGEHATPKRVNDGIYLLSARNVLNHELLLFDVDYISEEEYRRISKRIIPRHGDVLLSCSGSVGRCCVVPKNIKFQMVRSVALLRFKNTINPVFAEYLITSDFIQDQINSNKTASSQANLFQGKIAKLNGINPPQQLQNQFADFVAKVEQQKATVQKSIDKLETLKKSLMQEYFG